jgi:hypothetical protein
MLTSGSRRSSHAGSHQFARPSSVMVDGTSTIRTIVASTSTAVARPSPIIFVAGSSSSTNPMKTQIMMSAAEVMTRAVDAMPRMTAAPLSPVRTYSSRTRESRNTS